MYRYRINPVISTAYVCVLEIWESPGIFSGIFSRTTGGDNSLIDKLRDSNFFGGEIIKEIVLSLEIGKKFLGM